jgi:hypothetical protein
MNNSYTRTILLSICLTGLLFSLFAILFSTLGILSFNTNLSTGIVIAGLPIQIILLSFVIPALGLYTYRFLNTRFPNNNLEKFSLSVSNLMLGICIAFLFFGYLKLYTATTFIVVLALLLYIEYKNKLRFMYRFYRTYLVLLIPFYLGSMVLKKQSLFVFNENASLKLYLAYLPIEAYFYFMGILLMAVYLFELFKSKMVKVDG